MTNLTVAMLAVGPVLLLGSVFFLIGSASAGRSGSGGVAVRMATSPLSSTEIGGPAFTDAAARPARSPGRSARRR